MSLVLVLVTGAQDYVASPIWIVFLSLGHLRERAFGG